ncbi:hypothetical protein [Streptomyces acidicola]|uniref:Uncharacterized protein n=1 Tax=Streptomyces acidicola TaxID=2596892 RepID=A0A5N8WIK3_9ACTN|nr:hypothetical protein [Streptomyces acidicola]MPY47122.1 hypothetical protein [Streptomyces acidicola]MPY47261.1 hypothetical protein [Streptomyces acidicola]
MRSSLHRVGRQYAATIDRINAAAGAAVDLVEAQLRGCVGSVELAVSSESGMWELVADAHRPMFGRQDPKVWRYERNAFGTTTITRSGVLVVINAQACRGRDAEVDKTLLHEFTHAVQFNRSGARDLIMRSLANNYGIQPMTRAEAKAANKRVDADEREAAHMERHHPLLAQNIT